MSNCGNEFLNGMYILYNKKYRPQDIPEPNFQQPIHQQPIHQQQQQQQSIIIEERYYAPEEVRQIIKELEEQFDRKLKEQREQFDRKLKEQREDLIKFYSLVPKKE